MEKIKIGLIGLGPRGKYLFYELASCPETQAVVACDLKEECIDSAKEYFKENKIDQGQMQYFTDYKELLKTDVDAVLVATDVFTHCDIAIDCLNAGKHVLCEIPNISSFEEAGKLLRACRANPKSKFMVAENCCYWAFVNTWKQMYEQGEFGDIIIAEGEYLHGERFIENFGNFENQPKTWRSYLPAITYCTHETGPLFHILNDEPDEITGFVPGIHPDEEAHPAPHNGMLIIKTKKGTLIKINIGFGMHQPECAHNFLLYGTKGAIQNERKGKYELRKSFADLRSVPNVEESVTIPVTTSYPNSTGGGHGGADKKMMEDFVDCIVNDKKPDLGIEFGINISLPGVMGHISSQEGNRTIKMPTMDEIAKM